MQVDDKFIATQSTQHVRLAQAGLQALGHQLQHAVTERVAEGVIDDLEAVEIQKQDGKARVALARPLDGSVHTLRQQQTVGQAREYVAVGQLLNALLGGVLQRQIPHEADALHQTLFVVAQRHP